MSLATYDSLKLRVEDNVSSSDPNINLDNIQEIMKKKINQCLKEDGQFKMGRFKQCRGQLAKRRIALEVLSRETQCLVLLLTGLPRNMCYTNKNERGKLFF